MESLETCLPLRVLSQLEHCIVIKDLTKDEELDSGLEGVCSPKDSCWSAT